jgi:hypothetical protein
MGDAPNTRERALAVLAAIVETRPKLDALNHAAQVLYGDFYPHQSMMTSDVQSAVVDLLDAELDDMASYLLYETRSGPGAVTIGDRTWKIQSVDDVRIYLAEKDAVTD